MKTPRNLWAFLAVLMLFSCKEELPKFEDSTFEQIDVSSLLSGGLKTIRHLHFFNEMEGIMVLSYLGSANVVFYTNDQGNSWEQVHITSNGTPGEFGANRSGKALFIKGSYVEITTEKGQNWTQTLLQNSLNFGDITIAENGKFMATFAHEKIMVSSDGVNWKTTYNSDFPDLGNLIFLDDLNGLGFDYRGAVYHSNDTGESWTKQEEVLGIVTDTGINYSHTNYAVATAGSQNIWLSGQLTSWDSYATLWQSQDGGQTWSSIYSSKNTLLYPVALGFLEENRGFAVFADGNLYRTADGGRSWDDVMPLGVSPSNPRHGISFSFPSSEVGFLKTNNNLYRYQP